MPFKNLFLIIISLISTLTFSQKNKIYFDEDWEQLKNERYASYYRIVTKTDSGYRAQDYYLNGKIQMDGMFLDKKCITYNGKFVWYDEQGAVTKSATYLKDLGEGEYFEYYSNGQIKVRDFYTNSLRNGLYEEFYPDGTLRARANFINDQFDGPAYRYYEDGAQQLKMEIDDEGNGNILEYYENGKLITSGSVEDGYRIGEWNNYHENGKLFYTTEEDEKEIYKKLQLDLNMIQPGEELDPSYNSLISLFFTGYAFDFERIDGLVETPDVNAEFVGGYEALSQYIQVNLVYPEEAVMRKKQGTVYVRFIIETDGSISNVNVESGPICLREESIRVVKNMPEWNPAEFEGDFVRSYYELPIRYEF